MVTSHDLQDIVDEEKFSSFNATWRNILKDKLTFEAIFEKMNYNKDKVYRIRGDRDVSW